MTIVIASMVDQTNRVDQKNQVANQVHGLVGADPMAQNWESIESATRGN